MLICPKCRTTYSSSLVGACYRDGEKLVDHDAFVTAESDPMRGRLIGGKYRIVERVGQGGMGTVYRAVQSALNRNVAVKILKRELNVDRDTVARFHREANAMSLLTHPNTTRVYDFGQTDDGLLYLVMELLEGDLITHKLSREGALDVLDALRFTQQILRSLAEAHRKSIIHRDLKPDNIFVADTPGHDAKVIKVLDFGIAKMVAPDKVVDQFETQAGTVFGTPRYMSPEQAQGGQLDGRSDLYSVGTLLYQMLTGRAPFVDDDAVVVMAKHIREMPDAPRKAAPDWPIPKSLEDVVMRALAKDAGARFQEAAEFDAALEACVPDVARALAAPKEVTAGVRPVHSSAFVWSVLALSVLGIVYLGYRAFVPAPTLGGAVAAQSLEAAAAAGQRVVAPTVTRGTASAPEPVVVEPQPVVTPQPIVTQQEVVDPARVMLRSEPNHAVVMRDGRELGVTPLELLVQPGEEFVRVELHHEGFLPLSAELTARDGERVLGLLPVPPVRTTGKRRGRAAERDRAADKPAADKAPARKREGPYERFE